MDADRIEEPAAGSEPCLPRKNWGWFLARGLLLIVLGILALLLPGPALFAFATVFAAFCFVNGALTVASGVRGARKRRERWWALVLSGMAGLIVGMMFLLFPALFTFAYALTTVLLIAALALVMGVLEIVAAIRLRKEIKGEWLLALSGAMSVLLGLIIAAMAAVTPGLTALSVAWLLGIYALIAGVALTVLAVRLRRSSTDPAIGAPTTAKPA